MKFMKKFTVTLVIIFFLHLFSVNGFNVTQFTNGQNGENLTILQDSNVKRYIELPKNSAIFYAKIDIEPTDVDYVRTFNQLKYNNSVPLCATLLGSGITNCTDSSDQNDDSQAYAFSSGGTSSGYIYINYTIDPKKYYNYSLNYIHTGTDENYRVYFNCYQGTGFFPILDAQFARNGAGSQSGQYYIDIREDCIFENTLQMRINLLCEDSGGADCYNYVFNATLHEINSSFVYLNVGEDDSSWEWNRTKTEGGINETNVTTQLNTVIDNGCTEFKKITERA